MKRPQPLFPLFPYTTLFRSLLRRPPVARHDGVTHLAQIKIRDRKSTRLNSSHTVISYAVFCLKKKTEPVVFDPPRAKSGRSATLDRPRRAPVSALARRLIRPRRLDRFFFLGIRRPRRPTLFPYTTLFR